MGGEERGDFIAEVFSTLLAKPPDKIDKHHLSKIWRIKESEAEKVLDQSTIILCKGQSNPFPNGIQQMIEC